MTTPDREFVEIQRFLAAHDAVCIGCGYSLRALKDLRCPECGRDIAAAAIAAMANRSVARKPLSQLHRRSLMAGCVAFGLHMAVFVLYVAGHRNSDSMWAVGLLFGLLYLATALAIWLAVWYLLGWNLKDPRVRGWALGAWAMVAWCFQCALSMLW